MIKLIQHMDITDRIESGLLWFLHNTIYSKIEI